MAQKNGRSKRSSMNLLAGIPGHTRRAALAVVLVVVGLFLALAAFGAAGVAGTDAYRATSYLLGVGYFLLPVLLFIFAVNALREERETPALTKIVAGLLFFISGLGFIDAVGRKGGLVGAIVADPIVRYFDVYAALIVLGGVSLISLLLLIEGRIALEPFALAWRLLVALFRRLAGLFRRNPVEAAIENADEEEVFEEVEVRGDDVVLPEMRHARGTPAPQDGKRTAEMLRSLLGTYTPPPLSLLERDRGRPGVGDIKGNANLIKRTLSNFGIVVELDEISIGPSVTRYAIKPAEGVRLSKILALQQNLALALAAKGGIRIEAPIPGKSLVGIEVPNTAKVTVGLGALLEAQEFGESHKPLLVGLGRDIAGGSHFGNIAKMPHLLVAGATGSGKSVTIHTIINSLLYRLGPSQLRFIFIDPKRVELTLYRQLPHLLTPVITDPKRAIMALRWAGKEMQRRYDILENTRVRDIQSYHENILAPAVAKAKEGRPALDKVRTLPDAMPYIVIVIDELADIMHSYPRELESAIVRLAQMSRAVGIHLVLSTQRPSVNVITGLIKANVPARVALQVASQIDSRTILDQGGAETLLGAGDMLYLSADMSKPVRLQSAFISEKEVKAVVDFIAAHNDAELPVEMVGNEQSISNSGIGLATATSGGGFVDDEEIDDDLYEAARAAVLEAGKASTSYLQRKLRVGYARAARLIDVLEERGIIGPGDGAKPREVLERNGAAAPMPADAESV